MLIKNCENAIIYIKGGEVIMHIAFNEDKLKHTLLDFSNATGININFVDSSLLYADFYKIAHNPYCRTIQSTEQGKKRCFFSDCALLNKCKETKQTEICRCHAGLLDVAIPIFHDSMLLGYIIFGQIKTEPDFSKIKKCIDDLDMDIDTMRSLYESLPLCSDDKTKSIASIAHILVKYVILENMLKPNLGRSACIAVSFIEENLSRSMSVQYISKCTGISKTALYNIFKSNFNCTVNEYINTRRIEKSVSLLLDTDLSIEEISQAAGFSTAAYYSYLFKKQHGLSPLKFKKRRFEHKTRGKISMDKQIKALLPK